MQKFIIILSVSILFAAGVVSAQEGNATTETMTITAQDLGVANPNVLPDSPLYFFKELGRNIQTLFTFNAVTKAQLKEKISNEKLVELQKMVEQKKSQPAIDKAIKNYQAGVNQIEKAVQKIKENADQNPTVGKFLDKFVQQQTLQQNILQKLKTKVATSTFEKIEAARLQHLEKFDQVMQKLEENNQEKIQERLEKNIEKLSTPTNETLIKVRDNIMEKIQQKIPLNSATGTTMCITSWDPVCGINGKTYSNTCFAKLAGTDVAYKGNCEKSQCKIDTDCPQTKCVSTTAANVKCADVQAKCVEGICKIISIIPKIQSPTNSVLPNSTTTTQPDINE